MNRIKAPSAETTTLQLWIYFSPRDEHNDKLEEVMQSIERVLVESDARPIVIKRDPPFAKWKVFDVEADYTNCEKAKDARNKIIAIVRTRNDREQFPVVNHLLVDVCGRDSVGTPKELVQL